MATILTDKVSSRTEQNNGGMPVVPIPAIDAFAKRGKPQTAEALRALNATLAASPLAAFSSIASSSVMAPTDTGSEDAKRRIIRRGVAYTLGMLTLTAALLPISVPLALTALCLTGTVVLLTTLAYELNTTSSLDPTLMVYGTLLTLALAVVAFSGVFIR